MDNRDEIDMEGEDVLSIIAKAESNAHVPVEDMLTMGGDLRLLLRAQIDVYERLYTKTAVAFGNRKYMAEAGRDVPGGAVMQVYDNALIDMAHMKQRAEKDFTKTLKVLAKDYPVIDALLGIRGIGPRFAAGLFAMNDISTNCDTPSSLWRWCGYGVVDGVAEKRVKGQKLAYNPRLKTLCYLIGESLIKQGDKSPYRRIYDEAKEYYTANRPGWKTEKSPKGHYHMAAMRKMVKVFLAHLWEYWRESEGLATRKIYCIEKMGHTTPLPREEFGWPKPIST